MTTTLSVYFGRDPSLDLGPGLVEVMEHLEPLLRVERLGHDEFYCDVCEVQVGYLPTDHDVVIWKPVHVTIDLGDLSREPVFLCEDCAPLDGYAQVVTERLKALGDEEDMRALEIPFDLSQTTPEIREAVEAYQDFVRGDPADAFAHSRRVSQAFRAVSSETGLHVKAVGAAVQYWYVVNYLFPRSQ